MEQGEITHRGARGRNGRGEGRHSAIVETAVRQKCSVVVWGGVVLCVFRCDWKTSGADAAVRVQGCCCLRWRQVCGRERERHETVHDNEGGMASMAARQAMQFRGQRYVYPRKPKNQSVSMQRYVACLEM